MRIGMILDTERGFPPDIRVEKEARALCKAGFDVGLLCRAASPGSPIEEAHDYGLKVYHTTVTEQSPGFCSRQLRRARFFLLGAPVRKAWWDAVRAFIAQYRPEVLHCHDLCIVPTIVSMRDQHGLPIVADLHENMPAAVVAYRSAGTPAPGAKLANLLRHRVWRRTEKAALRHCARIIVVCPEASQRIVNNYGISGNRVAVVSNTEDENTFVVRRAMGEVVEKYERSWVACYVGGIGPHRGIDTAIRAAPMVGREIPNFRLLVVGARGQDQQVILALAEEVAARQYVDVVGWVPAADVPSYIKASTVCLVPHNDFEHTNTTVPHKLFQYMIMGKPVVVSSCAPLKRIVEETQAGLVFRANDSVDLARRLVQLHSDSAAAAEYGQNGRRAALGPYSWKHDARRLVDMYRSVEAELC